MQALPDSDLIVSCVRVCEADVEVKRLNAKDKGSGLRSGLIALVSAISARGGKIGVPVGFHAAQLACVHKLYIRDWSTQMFTSIAEEGHCLEQSS